MKRTTILIADDHFLMRMGLKALLAVQPDMEVIGEAANGRQCIDHVRELKPNVVVMDLMMPEIDGAEATKQILSFSPETKIVILTSFGNSAELLWAVQNGASAVQLKEDDEGHLLHTIREVANGSKMIPEDILALATGAQDVMPLTERQTEILHSVSRGLTNKDIARMEGISEVGVQKHLKLIFAKIGAANRSEAIAIALRRHLLKF